MKIECTTQKEIDDLKENDIAVIRVGVFILRGSSRAELWGSSRAVLRDSSSALYDYKSSISKTPLKITGKLWDISVFDYHIKIGCKLYLTVEWENFSDEEINKMDKEALEFWNKNKAAILAVAKSHQTYEDDL